LIVPPSTSSPCQLEPILWRGLEAYLLDNGLVRAIVVPALGGKIASLVDLKTGREWLWQNPHLEAKPAEFGSSYVARHDLGGFDECFPSVAATRYPAGPWESTPIPDHGEIWPLQWKADAFCDGSNAELRVSAHGVRFPYRFERTMRMSEGEPALRLSYNVTNFAPFPFPFLWSAHPILAVEPGMKLVVPLRDLTVYSSVDDRFGRLGTPQVFPRLVDKDGRGHDVSTLPDPQAAFAVKLFGKSPIQGFVAVQDPDRHSELRMQFDPEEVTHVGLWMNFGGWSGVPGAPAYYNLGLEPCIGAQDDLAIAHHQYKETGVLPPMGRKTWQLDLIMR
jgi:galactose mutarotase-like enzyme